MFLNIETSRATLRGWLQKVALSTCVLVMSISPIAAIAGEAPPTMTAVFDAYCQEEGTSNWFCGSRKSTLSESHKWEILAAYCPMKATSPTQRGTSMNVQQPRVVAAAAPVGRDEVCEAFLRVLRPLALEFNHRTQEWRRTNGGFESRNRRIDIDPVTRTPTAHLVSKDVVGVIVIDTNPMLFVANRGEAKEDNIDQLKSLEQLIALLGSSAGTVLTDIKRQNVGSQQMLGALVALRTESQGQLTAMRQRAASANRDAAIAAIESQLRVVEQEDDAESAFLADLARLEDLVDAAEKTYRPVQQKLARLLEHRARLQLLAQQLDFDRARLKGPIDATLEDPGEWHKIFADLAAAQAIPALSRCESVLDAFGPVVVTKPEAAIDVHTAAIRFAQLFVAGQPKALADAAQPCSELGYVGRLKEVAMSIETNARTAARDPADASLQKALRDIQADSREHHLRRVLVLLRLVRQAATVQQTVKDILAKEEETRKAAMVLRLIATRARDAAIERVADDEWIVTNKIFLPDEVYSSKWTKIQSVPLKISLSSPLAESVSSARGKEIASSYRFVRRGSDRFSFGVGLIYTTAFSSTLGAVDPDPSVNETKTTTTTTGGPAPIPVEMTQVIRPELKKIVEKEQLPRSGATSMFVNHRWLGTSAIGVGGQFGVATSTDNPAFFTGVALNLSQYVTLGIGSARFRVKRLDQALRAETVRVASADEIKIVNEWTRNRYASIAVNLSGLPLFK